MTPEQNLPDLLQREAIAPKRFDPRSAAPFVNKSVSEETRRAYRRAVADFFQFVGGKHSTEVVPNDVLHWRDHLRAKRQRAATVAFKLSVLRSFFEYLKAGGIIQLNPVSTKLVPPPELPTEPAGRALTAKEVRNLLSVPDQALGATLRRPARVRVSPPPPLICSATAEQQRGIKGGTWNPTTCTCKTLCSGCQTP